MKYTVSCHCGNVALDIEGKIEGLMACNCTICQRKGALMWFQPLDKVRFLKPANYAKRYTFNKHVIEHRFCPDCGMHPYGVGTDRQGNKMAAINARCIEGIELDGIPVMHYDGRSV